MADSLQWIVKSFPELNTSDLYEILCIRNTVFVLEQKDIYLDTDHKDQKALHQCGFIGDKLVAYCRLFRPGAYFDRASIGRVAVLPQYRGYGYGHQLMDKAIQLIETEFGETSITISAQLYLQKFYESHGFVKTNDMYLEENIPHIQMKKGV